MRSLLFSAFATLLAVSPIAMAGELDNEAQVTSEQIQLAQSLPATLVVRVNEATQEVEVLHSNQTLSKDDSTKLQVTTSQDFVKMDVKGSMTGELDQDSSKSSWYFHFPRYNRYYPSYYYYGYNYNYASYYNYYYAGYRYYYYGWGYYYGYNGWY